MLASINAWAMRMVVESGAMTSLVPCMILSRPRNARRTPGVGSRVVARLVARQEPHVGLVDGGRLGQIARGAGVPHLEEIGSREHAAKREVASPRVADDSRARRIHVRPGSGQLTQCSDVIGNLYLADAPVVRVLKGFAAARRAACVEHGDDESHLGEGREMRCIADVGMYVVWCTAMNGPA